MNYFYDLSDFFYKNLNSKYKSAKVFFTLNPD